MDMDGLAARWIRVEGWVGWQTKQMDGWMDWVWKGRNPVEFDGKPVG